MTTRLFFHQPWGVYSPGEVAGFPDAQAAALVASGVATIAATPAPQAATASTRPAPDPVAVAAANAVIDTFGTRPVNPDAGVTLAEVNAPFFRP